MKMSEELEFYQIFERGILIEVDETIHHYEVILPKTSEEYFSIQDISCDSYFTDDAPTCIDTKADTNDDDDAKAITTANSVCIKIQWPDEFCSNLVQQDHGRARNSGSEMGATENKVDEHAKK
ncbi:hypothetical protein QYM36_002676, partial [Artemia franciscana]